MSGGGQGSTSVQNNGPPAQYLDAYSQVLARANQNASTPYQAYTGQLQAGFSPLQTQGFNTIAGATGVQAPYINAAADNFTNATADLRTNQQPYLDEAQGQFTSAAGTDLAGALQPWQTAASQGFAGGSQAVDPSQYSASAIRGFESPYTTDVVDATQRQFDNQNAQASTRLRGNAASAGALGGDRLGVAQAELANQQQSAQAPVIAGLRNTGFQQAQQEFNTQQGVNLSAGQNNASRQLQGAQGFAGLGSQSLTAAQQQAAIAQQAGAGFAGIGQQELSAGQAQGWLNAQAGQGFASLGNEALSGTLQTGSADLSAGAQQQAQAQQSLNIPYQQWQAALAYPYQQTGWLSNIAQGLGSASGNVGSSTTPGGSTLGQVAGLGVGAAGVIGASGGFGQNGWLTGNGGAASSGAQIPYSTGAYTAATSAADTFVARGGRIGFADGGRIGFASGGGVPDLSINGIPTSTATPGNTDLLGGFGVPDASVSVIPSGGGSGGTSTMKRNYGTTTTSSGSGDSTFGTLAKTAGTIAATVYGGPAGGAAANALGSQVHFNRGGFAGAGMGRAPVLPRGFAAGGAAPITVQTIPNAQGKGVPTMLVNSAGGAGGGDLDNYLSTTAAGGYHPPATPPPAAAAAPAAAPVPAAGSPGVLGSDQVTQLQDWLALVNNQGNLQPSLNGSPGFRGGSAASLVRGARGFADGGDVDDPADDGPMFTPDPQKWETVIAPPAAKRPAVDDQRDTLFGFLGGGPDLGKITNKPVGQNLRDWWNKPSSDANPEPGLITKPWMTTPGYQSVGTAAGALWNGIKSIPSDLSAHYGTLNREAYGTAHPFDTDLSDPLPGEVPESDRGFGRGAGAHSRDDVDDTIGFGRGAGAHTEDVDPASSTTPNQQPDELPTPPTPPGQPYSGQPSSVQMRQGPAQPQPGTQGAPAISDAPSAAPASPRDTTRGFGNARNSDSLSNTRALREDRANPWLALATAGFGMAASRSPHPLQALAEGAGAGLNEYVTADKAAKDLAARIEEAKVRLADTQAYRQSTAGINQQKADAQTARAATYAAGQQARAAYLQAQADNPKMTPAQLRSNTIVSLMATVNPATGTNWTADEAFAHTANFDAVNSARQQRIAETGRHNQANEGLSADRNAIAFGRVMNSQAAADAKLALDRTRLDEATKTAVLQEAGRAVVADLTGKKTLESEVAALVKARSGLGSQPAQPAQTQAQPGGIPPLPAGLAPGSQYSPSRRMWRDPAGRLYDASGAPQ